MTHRVFLQGHPRSPSGAANACVRGQSEITARALARPFADGAGSGREKN
ncbi:hypothetical protein C7S16_1360 [Burkholderia thailandensis]|uniref:Uncharacterized protein n=1 Tax=Burkholderia thailandensis TaxID=57975 RepID=A0AAW9D576_BURTH|nr:hypothetical protein [Burkholderia thailandensis]MDW9257081.1 hypothetical protein [Burkholderia thailandensis]